MILRKGKGKRKRFNMSVGVMEKMNENKNKHTTNGVDLRLGLRLDLRKEIVKLRTSTKFEFLWLFFLSHCPSGWNFLTLMLRSLHYNSLVSREKGYLKFHSHWTYEWKWIPFFPEADSSSHSPATQQSWIIIATNRTILEKGNIFNTVVVASNMKHWLGSDVSQQSMASVCHGTQASVVVSERTKQWRDDNIIQSNGSLSNF